MRQSIFNFLHANEPKQHPTRRTIAGTSLQFKHLFGRRHRAWDAPGCGRDDVISCLSVLRVAQSRGADPPRRTRGGDGRGHPASFVAKGPRSVRRGKTDSRRQANSAQNAAHWNGPDPAKWRLHHKGMAGQKRAVCLSLLIAKFIGLTQAIRASIMPAKVRQTIGGPRVWHRSSR